MVKIIDKFLVLIIRYSLQLRYSISYRGLSNIESNSKVLFLPNHPAEVDPVILLSKLWTKYRPRPVVLEDFYYLRGLNWLMRHIDSIPTPNMWIGSGSYKRLRLQKGLQAITNFLDRGENVLIYPSGRLMRSGLEDLRAASAIFDILKNSPETQVILVRTTGLIGSSFSWPVHRARPDLFKCLNQGFLHIIRNLIFFTPRRQVLVEFEEAPSEIFKCSDKMELNGILEDWFNKGGEEAIHHVPYSRWSKINAQKSKSNNEIISDKSEIPEEIRKKVVNFLANKTGVEPTTIHDEQLLSKDLGLDSLDIAEIQTWIEAEFFISGIDISELINIYDVMRIISGGMEKDVNAVSPKLLDRWNRDAGNRILRFPNPDEPIQTNFLELCDENKKIIGVADELSGALNYGEIKYRVVLLADVIREFPGNRIGIMLPASVGSTLVIFGCLLAGKVPVMINWTLGDKNLDHVIKSSKLTKILTSAKFLDKLDQLNVKMIEDFLILLEDLRESHFTLARKLVTLFRSQLSANSIRKLFKINEISMDDTAVILYTSGSETVPKGVPLTHRNILSNIKGCLEAACVNSTDSLLAFLPPFHSFGFTITTLLPLLSGLKVCFYPNPLESKKLAQAVSSWQITMVCGTPTFNAGLLNAAIPENLVSLRLILTGAEKASKELYEKVETITSADLLEGYGITECSPVLTINHPGESKIGVGKPISGVEICIVDEEQEEAQEIGQRGLILVRGPNIFSGYLDRDSTQSFAQFENRKWYITGDLGFLNKDNYLTISGRLKRFVKIGGEMISLPAMEEVLQNHFPTLDGIPNLGLTYLETAGKRPSICLFTNLSLSVEVVNETLKKSGFSSLAKVNIVERIKEIPVLGTGKIDYRSLTTLLKENTIKNN